MDTLRPITPNIAIAGQPTEDDLRALKKAGYIGIVNLRNDGEPDQPMTTAVEGKFAWSLGLDYLHHGVGGAPLTPEGVTEVCDFLDQHAEGKVLVHCRSGGRAAAIVLLHQARVQGWSASEALAKGKAMGLEVPGGLKIMVEQAMKPGS